MSRIPDTPDEPPQVAPPPTAESGVRLRLVADDSTSVLDDGRVVLGGSPLRLLRLGPAGAAAVAGWLRGEPVSDNAAQRRLAARLVDAGVVHPEYDGSTLRPRDVTVVIPVRDHPVTYRDPGVAAVIVIDDGSARPVPGAARRHPVARGPAAARNAGIALADTELIAFVDADVLPEPGWLSPLLRHFEDPEVAAVAPRVTSVPGRSVLARYEHVRSSLNLGERPARVRPDSRVSYLPTAALVVRTSVLRRHGGFDERLRFGEDVDLVWRLVAAGSRVRYEPSSVVHHRPRTTWPGWLRQRFDYGTAAAPLAVRHGAAVAPLRVSRWSALAWLAAAAGRPVLGAAVALGTAALLPRKLAPLGVPPRVALRLALAGHRGAGRLVADLLTRTWGPVAVPLLAATRRGRPLLALALARHLADWAATRPPIDPARWLLARTADDLAYGAGVWWGCLRHHTVRPLVPDLSDWPGRTGATQDPPGDHATDRVTPAQARTTAGDHAATPHCATAHECGAAGERVTDSAHPSGATPESPSVSHPRRRFRAVRTSTRMRDAGGPGGRGVGR